MRSPNSAFEAIEAPSAAKALQLAEDNKSEIVLALVDLGLPDIPGEELVSQLRTRYPQLPIIVASGRGTGDMDAGLQSLTNSASCPSLTISKSCAGPSRQLAVVRR